MKRKTAVQGLDRRVTLSQMAIFRFLKVFVLCFFLHALAISLFLPNIASSSELDLDDELEQMQSNDEEVEKPKKKKKKKKKSSSVKLEDDEPARAFRYFVGGGYHASSTTSFSNASVKGGTSPFGFDAFALTLSHSSAPELSAGILWLPRKAIGFRGGLSYQLKRILVDSAVHAGVMSIGAELTSKPAMQIMLLEVAAAYKLPARLAPIYFFAGLNYSLASYNNLSTGSGVAEASGAIGLNIGGGYQINKKWNVEVQLKKIGVKASETLSDGAILDYGTGSTTGLALTGLYLF